MPSKQIIPQAPDSPRTGRSLKNLAREAVLEMMQAYLMEPPSVPDKVCAYLVALVDAHLFGERPTSSTESTRSTASLAPTAEPPRCWACGRDALPGAAWCAQHDPARNPQSAAALDRLDQDIRTGDQLLAEVKQEIKAAANGHHPSNSSDPSDLSNSSDPSDLSNSSDPPESLALLDQAEQILQKIETEDAARPPAPYLPTVNDYILALLADLAALYPEAQRADRRIGAAINLLRLGTLNAVELQHDRDLLQLALRAVESKE